MSDIDKALLKLNGAMKASDDSLRNMKRRSADLRKRFNPTAVARREFNSWTQSDEGKAFKKSLFAKQYECCANPNCKAGKFSAIEYLQIDHIQPLSKYPELALERSNFQLLCGPCNRTKSAQTLPS